MMKPTVCSLIAAFLIAVILLAGCGKTTISRFEATDTANLEAALDSPADIQTVPQATLPQIETTTVDYAPLINRIYGTNKTMPSVVLAVSAQQVNAGGQVAVAVVLNDAENVASFDFELSYNKQVFSVAGTKEYENPDVIMMTNPAEGNIMFSGITATTVNLSGQTLFSITFDVKGDAPAGPNDFKLTCTQFMVGADETGNETADLLSVKDMNSAVSVTVG